MGNLIQGFKDPLRQAVLDSSVPLLKLLSLQGMILIHENKLNIHLMQTLQ